MVVPVITRKQALKRVGRYGLSDELSLMLMFGTSSCVAGGYQAIVCSPPGKGYAQVTTVGIYTMPEGTKDSDLVDRFNVTI